MSHDFGSAQPIQLMPVSLDRKIVARYQDGDDKWTLPVIGFAIMEHSGGERFIAALVPTEDGGAEEAGSNTDFVWLEWEEV